MEPKSKPKPKAMKFATIALLALALVASAGCGGDQYAGNIADQVEQGWGARPVEQNRRDANAEALRASEILGKLR